MTSLQKAIERKISGDDAEAPLTFTLLYQATRDGFSVEKFHERCDGKGPTWTVLHGSNCLFGGYTSMSWISNVQQEKIVDEHAFLFHREDHELAETLIFNGDHANKERTITRCKTFGPTFGGTLFRAYDLQVFRSPGEIKNVSEQKKGFSSLNGSINFNNIYRNSAFKTQPNGGQLIVKDVEVYQVQDLEKYKLYDDIQRSVLDSVKNEIMMLYRKEVSLKTLFSALSDGCSAKVFHKLCDGKGPTLTLLYGKRAVYGGYTSVSWSSNASSKLKSEDAFLFCKGVEKESNINIYVPCKESTMIVCNKDYGPTFGEDCSKKYDLQAFCGEPDISRKYFKLNGTVNLNKAFKTKEECVNPFDKTDMDMEVRDIEVFLVEEKKEDAWRNINLSVKKEQIIEEIKNKLNPDMYGESMYNILLVGNIGAGKSSFVNTLTAAFQGRSEKPAVAASSARSVTIKFRGYPLSFGEETLPVRVFDTRGFDKDWTYESYMNLMLDGKLRDGSIFEDKFTKEVNNKTTKYESFHDMIHVVALVVDATNVEVYDKEMIQSLNQLRHLVYPQELKLVVIATRFDELGPILKKFPEQIYNNSDASKIVSLIASLIGVTEGMVIPFINYTNETENNQVLDKIALYALNTLVKEANNYRSIARRPTGIQSTTLADVTKVLKTKPSADGVKCLQFLCVGKVKSGKSTFIDSVKSALGGKRSTTATGGLMSVEEKSEEPMTRKVMRYPMKVTDSQRAGPETNACIVDMPGYSESGSVSLEKIKMIIEGHVKNKFEIENEFSKTSESYVKYPKLKDRIHVVCIILDHESVSAKTPVWEIEMIRALAAWLRGQSIPFVTVLTKKDNIGGRLNDVLKTAEQNFRIQRSEIYPVQNYVRERTLDDTRNAALLDALNSMLQKGLEYIENYSVDDD